jgi:hypothetical protein
MHAPRVPAVTWVVYKKRSSIKLYRRGGEARNFTIAQAGRSQHRSCAKKYENTMDIPHCNRLKRKPLVTNAIREKPPACSWWLYTRSWDVHEENIMPEPGSARGFAMRHIGRRAGGPESVTSSASARAKASPWRSRRSSCTRRAPCLAWRKSLRGLIRRPRAPRRNVRRRRA